MKYLTKYILKGILIIIVVIVLVVLAYVLYVVVDYNRIPDNTELKINKATDVDSIESMGQVPLGTELCITTYNVGFGAYSQDFSFFMDGGKYSRAIDEEHVLDNTKGALTVIKNQEVDFALFQEVDEDSDRSYHVNQREMFEEAFADFDNVYAVNFHSAYLMYPLTSPHGKSNSGIQTFSKYEIESALRRKFPISDAFPDKFFDLDRCYSITRILTDKPGKYLCIYNVHLSAYTGDDSIRNEQLKMLMEDMKNDYAAGNYVICGGDFNHDMLGNSDEVFANEKTGFNWTNPFPTEMIPNNFNIGINSLSDKEKTELAATCRNTDKEYSKGENEVWILDTFIVSDNIEINEYINIDAEFKYSDHNPVRMKFTLLDNDETEFSK